MEGFGYKKGCCPVLAVCDKDSFFLYSLTGACALTCVSVVPIVKLCGDFEKGMQIIFLEVIINDDFCIIVFDSCNRPSCAGLFVCFFCDRKCIYIYNKMVKKSNYIFGIIL